MKTITNERFVKTRHFISTSTSVAGLVMLIVSTVTAFSPKIEASPLPLLIAGVILSVIGLSITNRFFQPPIPHEALSKALRGLGKEAHLYHYWLPARHVLVCKHGIFTLTTYSQPATVYFEKDKWHTTDSLPKRLQRAISQNSLGDPIREARNEAKKTQEWLRRHLQRDDITVQPVIVFLNPKANVYADSPIIPATHADKRKPSLKAYIREQSNPTLAKDEIEQLETTLGIPSEQ